jgi:hypothetical protein
VEHLEYVGARVGVAQAQARLLDQLVQLARRERAALFLLFVSSGWAQTTYIAMRRSLMYTDAAPGVVFKSQMTAQQRSSARITTTTLLLLLARCVAACCVRLLHAHGWFIT